MFAIQADKALPDHNRITFETGEHNAEPTVLTDVIENLDIALF